MAEFSRGVKEYIRARAMVEVTFPVDFKGNVDISCYQCKYYRRNYRSCGLNGEFASTQTNTSGADAPLYFTPRRNKANDSSTGEQS